MICSTAKSRFDFKSKIMNSRASVLSHCVIAEESPNLQLNSGSEPGASNPLVKSLSSEDEALLSGDSTNKLYCSEVHFLKSTVFAVWATSCIGTCIFGVSHPKPENFIMILLFLKCFNIFFNR